MCVHSVSPAACIIGAARCFASQIRWVVLLSRQGKVRLAKWYTTLSQKDRAKILKEVSPLVLGRAPKLCNVLEWKDQKIVYKRYASLYFVTAIDSGGTREAQGGGVGAGGAAGADVAAAAGIAFGDVVGVTGALSCDVWCGR